MLIIISGPSGSGKGTVVKKLCEDDKYALSVSVTTRKKREGEVHGKDYIFCSIKEFYDMLNKDELLESARFVGNLYGTPRSYVEDKIAGGKVVVLEIEVNGALQVREKFPNSVLIFLIPPNVTELKRRLIARATEDLETIEDRMRRANEEIELVGKYDYLIINDEIGNAVKKINTIVSAEFLKPSRSAKLISKFKEATEC